MARPNLVVHLHLWDLVHLVVQVAQYLLAFLAYLAFLACQVQEVLEDLEVLAFQGSLQCHFLEAQEIRVAQVGQGVPVVQPLLEHPAPLWELSHLFFKEQSRSGSGKEVLHIFGNCLIHILFSFT